MQQLVHTVVVFYSSKLSLSGFVIIFVISRRFHLRFVFIYQLIEIVEGGREQFYWDHKQTVIPKPTVMRWCETLRLIRVILRQLDEQQKDLDSYGLG